LWNRTNNKKAIVHETVLKRLITVISNSFGFGGANAAPCGLNNFNPVARMPADHEFLEKQDPIIDQKLMRSFLRPIF
jgi:hypothetical protein